jgi:hypothetical protein
MEKNNKINSDIFFWFVFYLIAHGGILLILNAVYWDDWVLYRLDPKAIIERFTQQAGTLFYLEGYMHLALLKLGPWVYKVLTFILMFCSGLMLNLILKRHVAISAESRFFIVLLFLILPFNSARIALVDFRYTLCYFMFYLAWLLIYRYRLLSLLFFFLSFNTNSLLVFYLIPILDMFYRSGKLYRCKSIIEFCIQKVDFLLLPLIYFVIKIYFFSPSGLYEGYNQEYNLKNLIYLPVFQLFDLYTTQVNLGLCFTFSLISYFLIKRIPVDSYGIKLNSRLMFMLGTFVLFLGVFPYWIVGLLPTFNDWSSRHQLLLPLGGAIVVVATIFQANFDGKLKVISIVVGVSLAFNLTTYAGLFGDWQKQLQLITLFSKNEDIKRANLILIKDNTKDINAINRNYRFYEWNGILERSFGNEAHFAIDEYEYSDYLAGKYDVYMSSSYKAGLFSKEQDCLRVLVVIDLIKPSRFSDKLIATFFPRLSIKVSEVGQINKESQ